jgi:hypothetical protein
MADWGRHDGVRSAQALGFTHAPPCAATLQTIFRHVDRDACEAPLGAWADEVVGRLPPGPETPEPAIALAGQTLRGATKPGAPGLHGFSALAPLVGVTLAQPAVNDKTKESTAVAALLPPLVLDGRMVTLDARLTPRHLAPTMIDQGGDDGMSVKEHQPQRRAAIALVFTRPPRGAQPATARTVDRGHGRMAQRQLTTRAARVGDSAGPGRAPVCELGRHVIGPKTDQERVEGVSGVTSLRPARATPERLRALVRGQWPMANQSHGVREVTCDEDRSQVRCGNMPQVRAA